MTTWIASLPAALPGTTHCAAPHCVQGAVPTDRARRRVRGRYAFGSWHSMQLGTYVNYFLPGGLGGWLLLETVPPSRQWYQTYIYIEPLLPSHPPLMTRLPADCPCVSMRALAGSIPSLRWASMRAS